MYTAYCVEKARTCARKDETVKTRLAKTEEKTAINRAECSDVTHTHSVSDSDTHCQAIRCAYDRSAEPTAGPSRQISTVYSFYRGHCARGRSRGVERDHVTLTGDGDWSTCYRCDF